MKKLFVVLAVLSLAASVSAFDNAAFGGGGYQNDPGEATTQQGWFVGGGYAHKTGPAWLGTWLQAGEVSRWHLEVTRFFLSIPSGDGKAVSFGAMGSAGADWVTADSSADISTYLGGAVGALVTVDIFRFETTESGQYANVGVMAMARLTGNAAQNGLLWGGAVYASF